MERATTGIYLLSLLVIVIIVISFVQLPIKMNQVIIDEETYETAKWIDDYAEEHGIRYPENYVFSPWGRNRVYNYVVSGESKSYGYAQRHYDDFLVSTDGERWYSTLRRKPTGFIVTRDADGNFPEESLYIRLHENLGSRDGSLSGVSHYRAVYVSTDGSTKVFSLVPGARIIWTAPANRSVLVSTTVRIEGATFTYRRAVKANPYGLYKVTVPYAGEYTVGNAQITVSNADIMKGRTIRQVDREGVGHWPFDVGTGSTVHDRVGGHRGQIHGAAWSRDAAVGEHALAFDGQNDFVEIHRSKQFNIDANESFTISFFIKGDLSKASARYPTVLHTKGRESSRYGFWARTKPTDDFGVRFDDDTGTDVRNFGIDRTQFEHWTHVTAVLDRDADELRLYENGTLVKTVDATALGAVTPSAPLYFGARHSNARFAPTQLDDVRLYDRALNATAIRQLSNQ